jgi:glycosyltransferase involved in cell wall biosynthesis
MNKIGLCMIVKNEGKIIRRCLDSVKKIIDYVCIVDTGSTDNTVDEIYSWLKSNKIEGKVHKKEWVNFAINRTHALETIRKQEDITYAFMIDADEVLEYDEDFDVDKFKSNLTKDLYCINCRLSGVEYLRTTLTKNSMPFIYKGVVHEFLDCMDPIKSRETVKGITNLPLQDSARNEHKKGKFLKDAKTLEDALKVETDPYLRTRYMFYLAQSYNDGGEKKKALEKYLERTKLGGWAEEVSVSYYKAGNIMWELEYPEEQVIQTLLTGFEVCPQKIECLHSAAKYCRVKKKYQQAFMIASLGLKIKKPDSGLFLVTWIWDYGLEDEYSISAYWAGYLKEGLEVARKLIKKVPDAEKNRVIDNLNFYLDKIQL